ncbi:hypothetical protein Tco_0972333 [Tanacetum coccineum]
MPIARPSSTNYLGMPYRPVQDIQGCDKYVPKLKNNNLETSGELYKQQQCLILMSFMSTAFSSQIDIIPTVLDHDYDVELADEKIIKSKSKQEHEEHLKLILELLKKEELYAIFSKCEFWIPKAFLSLAVIIEIRLRIFQDQPINDEANPEEGQV